MKDDDEIMVAGLLYKKPGFVALLENLKSPYEDVKLLKRAYEGRLKERDDRQPATTAMISAVIAGLWGKYTRTNPVLAHFGQKPLTQATLTVEQKALAVAKNKATRIARKTMGPRQKEAIKGDVTSIEIKVHPVNGNGNEPAPTPAPSDAPPS